MMHICVFAITSFINHIMPRIFVTNANATSVAIVIVESIISHTRRSFGPKTTRKQRQSPKVRRTRIRKRKQPRKRPGPLQRAEMT